jgi:hypothetical protein
MAHTDWACEPLEVTATHAIIGLTGGIPPLKATIAAVEGWCLRVFVPPPPTAAAAPAATSASAVGAEASSTAAARPVAAADAVPLPPPQSRRHAADDDTAEGGGGGGADDADAPTSSIELPPAYSRGAAGAAAVPAQWDEIFLDGGAPARVEFAIAVVIER